ncbi:transcriptional Coactivator p15-domain-containing protein [Parachaetomium inaequale]|uniref:Transcriptional Coactivator p15-domain-containing protein n=1 Tax=Parachaetomium inaequale TaxID=2588326 RepID=A0AAN6SPI0_9PEZI|nr:transcriptional Coactivator p15-domain-containing protein [Parachaetomium inaequale]
MPYNKKRQIDPESDGEQQVVKKPKNEKKAKKDLTQGTDAEGNPYWEIGNNRRIGSSQFKGATLVNIREYYTAPDGELRPGKKGISLSLDQYKALLKVIPELNEQLRSQGHQVDSTTAAGASNALVKADEPPKAKKSQKANIDATSDEEDDE